VHRDPVLSGVDIDGHVNGFSVTDTGVGLDETNLDSFSHPTRSTRPAGEEKALAALTWELQYAEGGTKSR
jgi:hypothetical protein